MSNDWFEETHENIALRFRLKERLFVKQSDFQKVEVVETQEHGKLLAHDGMIMVTERDEFVYHDMITHVPMHTHPQPKNILVIGGGDGGTVREVLRHPTVEKVTMVEIDGVVVEASKKFIPQTANRLSDPKVDLRIADGVDFVKNTDDKFDVIIVDSSEPIGPATPLFNINFYKDVDRCLATGGAVVAQGESPYYDMKMQKVLLQIMNEVFPKVHIYNYCNMSYPSGLWSFAYASHQLCPIKDFDPSRVQQSFQYYNQDIHWGSFMIPQFMREELKGLLSDLPQPSWS
jgi:spermidine synthase